MGLDKNLRILKRGKLKVLLHIPSSRVFKIDELTEKIIETIKQGRREEEVLKELSIKESPVKIKRVYQDIKESGILEEKRDFEPQKNFSFTSISLFTAQSCNLRCKYCYGEGGTYGSNFKFMEFKVAKKGIDLLIHLLPEDKEDIGINFFGGEPLLNFSLIQETVEYAKEICSQKGIKLHLSLTTNGTILSNEIAKFLFKNRFRVLLSIDGPPEFHNKHRVFANGKGSYKEIYKNLPIWLSKVKNVSARATYIPSEMDLWKIVKHLNEIGFKKYCGRRNN
jgi:uncharacterized protein